ncbi:HAMP domain-containing sensor histidine kinase [Nonomuraea sp. NPDC048882]|uniref:sensor histidine kinase n=1 Tax=Nonomuraea sp. NPDC048882 TaxID=3154347 RepID=UPI0033E2B7A1
MRLVRPLGRVWPLRRRLLAALLGLSAAALAVFAAAGVLLLDRSLMSRVDTQLTDFAASFARRPPPPPPASPPPDRDVELPSQFRVAFFTPSGAELRRLPGSGQGPAVPARAVIDPPPGPFTVPARSGADEWRTIVLRLPDGNRAAVSISLADNRATVRQLLLIEAASGALVLVLLGTLAHAVVRLGLRPLTRMERTATAIAAGDLERRVSDSDPRTETGRLGHALNVMLGRLAEALRQRERSERRLRHFLADASHELRTPLTSIRGFAELYRHGGNEQDPAVARLLSRIESEAERMGVLVADLLLLARLDQERALDLTEVDLHVIAGDVVHGARARHPGRSIELVLGERPVRVIGDEHRLHRVVENLVGNAVAHTPEGAGVRVLVGARDPATALVEVRDEGPGIDPEHLPHVFERFYRADPARSPGGDFADGPGGGGASEGGFPGGDGGFRTGGPGGSDGGRTGGRGGGTGLGLAIAAALVEAHDGRIEVRSRPGRGTVFQVLLPVRSPGG